MFEASGNAFKMIRQVKRETRKTDTVQTVEFYAHHSSSSSISTSMSTSTSTSSCSSLHSLTSFTKTESRIREVHAAARAMFPEFFAQTTVTKRLLTAESSEKSLSRVTCSIQRSSEPQKCHREIEDEIKSWFIREYGLDTPQISCR